MEKYRIKIETRQSGEKLYSPECYIGGVLFGYWTPIDSFGDVGAACYGVSIFREIDKALEAIDKRRELLIHENNKLIINVEYTYL